ncbi:MAG: sodium:calcium antiporter [Pseudomonadota bacterium]
MLADFAVVLGGTLVILVLAEVVIRQSVLIRHHYGLSGSFLGLTLLSVGTSLLEIMNHVIGSIHILRDPGSMVTLSALLLGSNVGSDIFQQNVVLAVVGLFATVVVVRRNMPIEVGGLVAASVLLWLACLGGAISRVEGGLLVAAYLAYLAYLRRFGEHEAPSRQRHPRSSRRLVTAFGGILAGFAGMAWLADPVLVAASHLVERLPMSASLFGVVVLGICAALPELMTAMVSALKGERGIAAAVLIGSNITNPLLGVGLGAMLSGYVVPAVTVAYDLPVKITTGVLLYFLLARGRLGRRGAAALIAIYIAYVLLRGILFPQDLY